MHVQLQPRSKHKRVAGRRHGRREAQQQPLPPVVAVIASGRRAAATAAERDFRRTLLASRRSERPALDAVKLLLQRAKSKRSYLSELLKGAIQRGFMKRLLKGSSSKGGGACDGGRFGGDVAPSRRPRRRCVPWSHLVQQSQSRHSGSARQGQEIQGNGKAPSG
eukprot:361961-Chlamydomonas_euryale.AAC.4